MKKTIKSEFETKYVRTDLACESGKVAPANSAGTIYEKTEICGVTLERMCVLNEAGEADTGKKIGKYITLSGDGIIHDIGHDDEIIKILSNEIKSLCESAMRSEIKKSTHVLVAGVGNRSITPDALGPMTADLLSPTRHIINSDNFSFLECSEVSVIKTAVMGQTGIESAEILKAISERIHPDIIITIDALAARSVSRLASTIQLSDCGISPGSGIGNARCRIDEKYLSCPVVSIGVPTVVDSATLIFDTMEKAGIEEIEESIVNVLEKSKSFFVSPKNCDSVNERLSFIISQALGETFGCRGL